MTMSDALTAIAPNTIKMFSGWLMEEYGMKMSEFEKTQPKRKYYEVSKYFGYSLIENTDLPVETIISSIKKIFSEYEDIIVRYPDGPPNFLKTLKDMSHEEKTIWLNKNFTREINISLCHALVKGNNRIRVSLSDALVERQLSQLEMAKKDSTEKEKIEQQFWTETIKNFNKDEIAPF